jgi:hypothetical protein
MATPQEFTAVLTVGGPPGPQGPPGPASSVPGPAGPAGPTGPQGYSSTIKGSVATSASLPTTGNTIGDSWVATDTGHLWQWGGSGWIDIGKIVGPAGPAGPAGSPSPWTSNVDAAGYQLHNVSRVGVGVTTPGYALDVAGDVSISGHFYRNGIQLAYTNQNVATAARTAGTVYVNNTGKTLFVITCWNLGGKNSTISALSDTANPPVTEVAQIADASASTTTVELFFLVLAGYNYLCSVTAGTPTLVSWVEYS